MEFADHILNINFGNKFHHQNGPNQHQHVHKPKSQHYQFRTFQISRTSSIKYLEEDCGGCGLNNKGLI